MFDFSFTVDLVITGGREHYTDQQLIDALVRACLVHYPCPDCMEARHHEPYDREELLACRYTREILTRLAEPLIVGPGQGMSTQYGFDHAKFAADCPLLSFRLEYGNSDRGPPKRMTFSGGRMTQIQEMSLQWGEIRTI